MTGPLRIMAYGFGKGPEPTTEERIRTEALAKAFAAIEEGKKREKEERLANYLKSVSSINL